MRGQYDALLRWPFRQKVTFMLLDQDNVEHVILIRVVPETEKGNQYRQWVSYVLSSIGVKQSRLREGRCHVY